MPIDPRDIAVCQSAPDDDQGAAAPAIAQTALHYFPDFQSLEAGLSDEFGRCVYARGRNPTVEIFERMMAALERAECAKAFASGMGAISAIFHGLLKSGDHVLFANQIYGPVLQLARRLERFGVAHDVVRNATVEAVARAFRPQTRLVWLENPGTMTMGLIDVEGIAKLATSRGALSALDNSWATPLFQKPIELGVDLVAHSCSKYIGGHSDVLGGVVAGKRALVEEVFHNAFMLNGAAPSPFDAWLLVRSLRTLPLRMPRHEANAHEVATALRDVSSVDAVLHPAFSDAPWRKALKGTSGLFSITLKKKTYDDVVRVLNALKRFRLGVSWGGFESAAITPERRGNGAELHAAGIPRGLIRLSVGLEGADALIDDLKEALA